MRLLLVDGPNIVMRCAYGGDVDPLIAAETATRMIERACEQLGAAFLAIAVEGLDGVPCWRRDVYADYKGHRTTDTARWVAAAVELWAGKGWATVSAPGFEADDVLATLVTRLVGRGRVGGEGHQLQVVVLSGDSDLLEFTRHEGVEVARPAKGGTFEVLDHAAAAAKFQLGSAALIPQWKALAGEPGDNVPGPFGKRCEVKARKLLEKHGDLAGVLAAGGLTDEQLMVATLAWALVQLRIDAPVAPLTLARCELPPRRQSEVRHVA